MGKPVECPQGVREAVCEILYNAALAIRFAGTRNEAKYCAIEAGHIHNLPHLITAFTVERLRYYLDVEVPAYLQQLNELPDAEATGYSSQWDRLRELLASLSNTAS